MFPGKISSGPIEDGLDRKHLATLKRRFLEINSARLMRTQHDLAERQVIFLELLPLLFHTNHPMLPGYISQDSPAGVALYQPDEKSLQAAKKISRSFRYNTRNTTPTAIEAIFLMGSVGTIAYNRKSDLDLWICYTPDLSAECVRELNIKCQLLMDWALQLGLETHLFLMNAQEFSQGMNHSLSKEASGDTQHYLLLDEFYRSSILVAGKMPVWWFVPSTYEKDYEHYSHTLTSKRFLPERDLISLGSVAVIPDAEFIGAGVWQLYKAIEAPYKSVLKLLLLEIYASESPSIHALSLQFKQSIYNGELDVDQLDPYVVCYQRIEDFLVSRRETDRLALLRRCFYFKVNRPLTKHSSQQDSWQKKLLASLVNQWNWSEKYIAYLDNRPNWKATDVMAERRILVKELNRCYRTLLSFERHNINSTLKHNQDLSILGRKLSAYFERRPGKIDFINAGGVSNLNEEVLCFVHNTHSDPAKKWQLYSEKQQFLPTSGSNPLLQEDSLLRLLLWAYRNELLTPQTSLYLLAVDSSVQEAQLTELYEVITRWLPLPLPRIPHESYFHPAFTTDVLILVNLVNQPKTEFSERGLHRISENDDAFNYGAFNESLIMDISIATRNNWNEISCFQFDEEALANAIRFLVQQLIFEHINTNQPPRTTVHCMTPHYGSTIKQQVGKLFNNLLEQRQDADKPAHTRYVYSEKNCFYCCDYSDVDFRITECPTEAQLLGLLAEPNPLYRSFSIDTSVRTSYPLALLASVSHDEAIHVVYSPRGHKANIYVIDEKGSLFHYQSAYQDHQLLLTPLHKFIRNCIPHLAIATQDDRHFGVYPVKFYRHVFDDLGEESLVPAFPATQIELPNYHSLGLRIEQHDTTLSFTLLCDGRTFRGNHLDDTLFRQIEDYLLTKQEISCTMPCYLTDIDFATPHNIEQLAQTTDYLHLKAQIEARLNTTIDPSTELPC